ncbi:MAG TPA: PIN domain-containing protein [Atribacteraceae bacterium]|nr:PIN domain-containing protein [Atribacteraceae bacterium]
MTKTQTILIIVVLFLAFIISFFAFRTPISSLGRTAWGMIAVITLAAGILTFLMEKYSTWSLSEKVKDVFGVFFRLSSVDILVGMTGLILGLVVGVLISYPVSLWQVNNPSLPMLITVMGGVIGFSIFMGRREDIVSIFTGMPKTRLLRGQATGTKILDTSAIVDGRIADVCKTGFIEGDMLVPRFVLKELQQVADSQDPLKRSRGRRGLDILNRMRKEKKVNVRIADRDFPEIRDVDAKLIKLGKVIGGTVITNDFNLNKIAELEGVEVLNINDLANALKPYLLPGEELRVQIIREGKESDQGVGYLDDGTMVVVEGGKRHINNTLDTVVTSVLQTPAGRMIFVRPRGKTIHN